MCQYSDGMVGTGDEQMDQALEGILQGTAPLRRGRGTESSLVVGRQSWHVPLHSSLLPVLEGECIRLLYSAGTFKVRKDGGSWTPVHLTAGLRELAARIVAYALDDAVAPRSLRWPSMSTQEQIDALLAGFAIESTTGEFTFSVLSVVPPHRFAGPTTHIKVDLGDDAGDDDVLWKANADDEWQEAGQSTAAMRLTARVRKSQMNL